MRLDRCRADNVLKLIHNAFEALAARGTSRPEVCVHTGGTASGDLELAVCDNGPGVALEAAANLFDPFFSTKPNATGLGLSIANTVMRAHGGLLSHRPHAPRDACFYIHLPAEASELLAP